MTQPGKIKLLIADDHLVARSGIKGLLAGSEIMVVAEVTYLVGSRLGARVEAAFLASLTGLDVEVPTATDWPRIAELVGQYADFPLGGTDASVIALAERLGTDVIITLDRRHFGAVRPAHWHAWRLLPE